jgi:hypothetical protein
LAPEADGGRFPCKDADNIGRECQALEELAINFDCLTGENNLDDIDNRRLIGRIAELAPRRRRWFFRRGASYSHSIVPGGLLVTS